MGVDATARLAVGVDLGIQGEFDDDVMEWLARLHGDNHDASMYETASVYEAVEGALGNESDIEAIRYSHYDCPGWFIGFEVAWAVDYGSEKVDVANMVKTMERKNEVVAALRKIGAPEKLLDGVGLYVLAEYS